MKAESEARDRHRAVFIRTVPIQMQSHHTHGLKELERGIRHATHE